MFILERWVYLLERYVALIMPQQPTQFAWNVLRAMDIRHTAPQRHSCIIAAALAATVESAYNTR